MPQSNDKKQRTTRPVAPENSALADELRSQLKGKPTRTGFNRSWTHEAAGFIGDIVRVVVVALLCLCFTFGGFGAGMLLGYASTTKPLSIGDLTSAEESQTSFVYDSENNQIAKLTGSENVDRIYVSYSAIKNTYLDDAIIAIEDERFREHSGIDIKRIGSALLSAIANGGSATHGGSTITQQTVKLISGQDEHSTSRKVQEWFSAMTLEQSLTKDEILDAAIVQKLLPKLHGSRKKLEPVLQRLWKLCFAEEIKDIQNITADNIEKAKYKESADKISRMYDSANVNGFTSFAEA